MDRKDLSPEEREEYDALFEEAGLDEFGNARKSEEIKERMRVGLEEREQGGSRFWLDDLRRDALEDGLLRKWKSWYNRLRRMPAAVGDVVVDARAARNARRRDPETAHVFYQATLWREMSWEEVRQQYADARTRIAAENITVSIASRLFALYERCPDSAGPAEACERLGISFDRYIAGEENVA